MNLLNISTGEYPVSYRTVLSRFPGVLFPREPNDVTLSSFGYAIVKESGQPDCTIYQRVIEIAPVQIDGIWTQQWSVADLEGDDLAAVEQKLAREQAEAELAAAKLQVLQDNFSSWVQVETMVDSISTLAEAKAFLKKLARVNHLFIKEKTE